MAAVRPVLSHALLDHLARYAMVIQHLSNAVADQNGFAHVDLQQGNEQLATAGASVHGLLSVGLPLLLPGKKTRLSRKM